MSPRMKYRLARIVTMSGTYTPRNSHGRIDTLLNDALRFTEQNRNVLAHVEAIANEEGHHDDISRPGKLVALRDARFFVQEDGLDVGIKFPGPD